MSRANLRCCDCYKATDKFVGQRYRKDAGKTTGYLCKSCMRRAYKAKQVA